MREEERPADDVQGIEPIRGTGEACCGRVRVAGRALRGMIWPASRADVTQLHRREARGDLAGVRCTSMSVHGQGVACVFVTCVLGAAPRVAFPCVGPARDAVADDAVRESNVWGVAGTGAHHPAKSFGFRYVTRRAGDRTRNDHRTRHWGVGAGTLHVGRTCAPWSPGGRTHQAPPMTGLTTYRSYTTHPNPDSVLSFDRTATCLPAALRSAAPPRSLSR